MFYQQLFPHFTHEQRWNLRQLSGCPIQVYIWQVQHELAHHVTVPTRAYAWKTHIAGAMRHSKITAFQTPTPIPSRQGSSKDKSLRKEWKPRECYCSVFMEQHAPPFWSIEQSNWNENENENEKKLWASNSRCRGPVGAMTQTISCIGGLNDDWTQIF